MAIIGYIPPAAEPIPEVNAQPVPDTAAEEKPAKRTKRAATKE